MMWGSLVPSPEGQPALPHSPAKQCVCVCFIDPLLGFRPACDCILRCPGCVCLRTPVQPCTRLASPEQFCFLHWQKGKKTVTKTWTVTCTHTQASTEVSCDHATYLHSGFKETVYKAVVYGGLFKMWSISWWLMFFSLWIQGEAIGRVHGEGHELPWEEGLVNK